MSQVNEYVEGEKVAEVAVRDGVARKQLDSLSSFARARPNRDAILFAVRKQTSRGYLSVGLERVLEDLVDRIGPQRFAIVLTIAYDYYLWKATEGGMRRLWDKKPDVEKLVNEYSAKNRLGRSSVSIRIDQERIVLDVRLDRPPYDRRRAAEEIANLIRGRVPELSNLNYLVWFTTEKEVR